MQKFTSKVRRRHYMQHLRQHNYSVAGLLQHFCTGSIRVFLSTILTAVFFLTTPVHGTMDIADEPMMAVIKPAPANIMFLLDDSGSMTFEVLTADYYEGRFPNPEEDERNGYGYIFDDGDHHVAEDVIRYMGPAGRKFWKSQFHEYNVIYYNPRVTYDPWPGYGDQSFPPADQEFPKHHPLKKSAGAIDLDGESFSVSLEIDALPDDILQVKHAHYFQKTESGDIYLVVLDGDDKKTKYNAITQVEGSGMADIIKRVTSVASPPGEIRVH